VSTNIVARSLLVMATALPNHRSASVGSGVISRQFGASGWLEKDEATGLGPVQRSNRTLSYCLIARCELKTIQGFGQMPFKRRNAATNN
jgi:hypothetical protein